MMSVSRRDFLKASGVTAIGLGLGGFMNFANAQAVFAQETDPTRHVLNRTTWGIRPQDIATIQSMGIEGWIDYQLNYEAIPDPVVNEFIAQRRVMTMPIDELAYFTSDNYGVVMDTFLWARLFRAAYSERQLYEVMVEFWTDHFNIPVPDYLDVKLVDDRDVIRKHALGKFRDLLFASAQSPAMLRYLDQAISHKDHPNENYARELMELHTLGVDGGYTEVDVVEVARALTGWTLNGDGYGNQFLYDPDAHDTDAKTILGVAFPAGRQIEDGLQVIDILSRHSSTARFIAKKLCRKFVSDTPSQELIDSTALEFIATDGDIKQVVRHILTSAEFMGSSGQKFRRPMEFMVALLRVLSPSLQVNEADLVVYGLEPMGQIPYHWFPPNGYPDVAGAWLNTNGILHRWNTALTIALAGDGLFEGATMNLDAVIPQVATVGEMVNTAIERILGISIPSAERALLVQFVSRTGDENQAVDYELRYTKLPSLVGLLMASPYFQWH
jgi:hypothetical protein